MRNRSSMNTIYEVTFDNAADATLTNISVRRFKTRRDADDFAFDNRAANARVHESAVTREMAKRYGL